ncbi:MAG: hypothetical protein K5686_01035 [Lachnospiraceae bacterium]|nr:hypothetical protein [Lachnospiraceae bacterium]
MKKRVLLLIMLFGLTGCAGKDIDEGVSVLEEIQATSHQKTVPAEAYEYISLSYTIPDGFIRNDSLSTEDEDYYYSKDQGDYSYIMYSKKEKDQNKDYKSLSESDYQAALNLSLGTSCTIEDFSANDEGNGCYHVLFTAGYSDDHSTFKVREHCFITNKYVFQMVYGMDQSFNKMQAVLKSEESLQLESLASLNEK